MDYQSEPLFKVQKAALTDQDAVRECARRWAANYRGGTGWRRSLRVQQRLAVWFIQGFNGAESPIISTNFDAPIRAAWSAGVKLAAELRAAVTKAPIDSAFMDRAADRARTEGI